MFPRDKNRLAYATGISLSHAKQLVRVKGCIRKGHETPLGSVAAPDGLASLS